MLVTYTLVKIVPNLVSYVVESDFEDNSRGENRGNKHGVLLEKGVVKNTRDTR